MPGAALIAVHRTRKQCADDFIDSVSGTQGIAGAADSVIVLSRKRKSDDEVLSVTGRDIEENEYAVRADGGLWSLDGMDILDADATVNTRRDQASENRLGTRSLDAMKFVNGRESTTPAELAAHLGTDNRQAAVLLGRLHDDAHIDKQGRGVYVRVVSGVSVVTPGQSMNPSPGNTPLTTDATGSATPLFGTTNPTTEGDQQ